eukprot:CAMPEP_0198154486 /NCGR_PEP_ID=MMETSP1443-20131203/68625_1 /TAXON_ID=186043 /ORGANISM="Entomoneis sp., Strain CCMP2396" /LENGTH=280 /DNA_ID=CAMNT_0043821165 /DNA_START=368 /DNA_END=1210 /DNA_ORIENTATION=+
MVRPTCYDPCSVEYSDYETCGCQDCVQPIFDCFDECTPSCLNSTVDAYYDCMVRPTCYDPCSVEYSDSISSGSDFSVVDINLTLTSKDCSIIEFFADPIDCLYPIYPECSVIQDQIVEPTCNATKCCDQCYEELEEVESCVYNWISGRNCSFTCPAAAEGRNLLADGNNNNMFFRLNGEARYLLEAPFKEECRSQLAQNTIQKPGSAVQEFVDCIASHTIEDTVSSANAPPPTTSPTLTNETDLTAAPTLTNETDPTSNGSHAALSVLVATSVFILSLIL